MDVSKKKETVPVISMRQMDSWGAYPKMHGFGEIRDAP
ncbi:predicted protein [Botrytis cinerea T4]|uniref:Uncharacterized protein n=1 Tax=Botryotinia fuckeliana (strain T4) TaxID=999810 RepID=G2XX27_BOTF4|nr:predicted protein [Botrytis cinerea T4]